MKMTVSPLDLNPFPRAPIERHYPDLLSAPVPSVVSTPTWQVRIPESAVTPASNPGALQQASLPAGQESGDGAPISPFDVWLDGPFGWNAARRYEHLLGLGAGDAAQDVQDLHGAALKVGGAVNHDAFAAQLLHQMVQAMAAFAPPPALSAGAQQQTHTANWGAQLAVGGPA